MSAEIEPQDSVEIALALAPAARAGVLSVWFQGCRGEIRFDHDLAETILRQAQQQGRIAILSDIRFVILQVPDFRHAMNLVLKRLESLDRLLSRHPPNLQV